VLTKWRFVPEKKGSAGEARYQWSDGLKTKEKGYLVCRCCLPSEGHPGQRRSEGRLARAALEPGIGEI
jgi:hypothetical protein